MGWWSPDFKNGTSDLCRNSYSSQLQLSKAAPSQRVRSSKIYCKEQTSPPGTGKRPQLIAENCYFIAQAQHDVQAWSDAHGVFLSLCKVTQRFNRVICTLRVTHLLRKYRVEKGHAFLPAFAGLSFLLEMRFGQFGVKK